MVHPAFYVVSLGVAIGVAVFAYFASNQANHYQQPHRYPTYPGNTRSRRNRYIKSIGTKFLF